MSHRRRGLPGQKMIVLEQRTAQRSFMYGERQGLRIVSFHARMLSKMQWAESNVYHGSPLKVQSFVRFPKVLDVSDGFLKLVVHDVFVYVPWSRTSGTELARAGANGGDNQQR